MKARRKLFLIGFGCSVSVGLALVFAFPMRDAFMRLVVTPLIESFMILRWYVHRLSQLMLWVVFVIGASIIVIRSLTRAFPFPKRSPKQKYHFFQPDATNDLKRLSLIISHAHHRSFARRKIASELVPLCTRIIAHRERLKLQQARERFESFQWCDDEAVQDFFDYRRQYHGLGKARDFQARLGDVISFLERYYQGV